jgi:hypothetical protein
MILSPLSFTLVALIASFLAQAPPGSDAKWTSALFPEERAQLARQSRIEGRVPIYQKASARFAPSLEKLVHEEKFAEVRKELELWKELIAASRDDIVASVPPGKRPKAVIRYEIHLRKMIAQMQSLRVKASVEAFDAFERWGASAEECRKAILAVIFPG